MDQDSSPFPPEGSDRKIRILLCSGDAVSRRNDVSALSDAGYDVRSVLTPADGVSEFKSGSFAAVVTDADMAPVDGFAFRSMIRACDSRVPVLIQVVRNDDSDNEQLDRIAQDNGSYLIPKNMPNDLLLNKLHQVLSAYHAELELVRERENVRKKLELARCLQEAMLPPMLFIGTTFEYGYLYQQHHSISGDLIERIPVSDDACTFVFGNLAGRGVHAALSMIAVQSFLKNIADDLKDQPYRIAGELHRFLRGNLRGLVYMCTLIVFFDFRRNIFRSFNAGLFDMLCFDASSGALKKLNPERKGSIPVGMTVDAEFRKEDQVEVHFCDGDIFSLSSDGFAKISIDPDGEECLIPDFYRDLLIQTAGQCIIENDLISTPYAMFDLLNKSGYVHLQDDASLFILRKLPQNAPRTVYFNCIRCNRESRDAERENIVCRIAEYCHDRAAAEKIADLLCRYLAYITDVVYESQRTDAEYIVLKLTEAENGLNATTWDRGQNADMAEAPFLAKAPPFIRNFNRMSFAGINQCFFSILPGTEAL